MPLQWSHSLYWKARANPVISPQGGPGGGYPTWQSHVVLPSLFGALAAVWPRLRHAWREFRYWWSWRAILRDLGPDERQALAIVVAQLRRQEWVYARLAVSETAHTRKGHQPGSWVAYSRLIKADWNRAENVYRRVKAEELLQDATETTLTNPEKALLVELAYQTYGAVKH